MKTQIDEMMAEIIQEVFKLNGYNVSLKAIQDEMKTISINKFDATVRAINAKSAKRVMRLYSSLKNN